MWTYAGMHQCVVEYHVICNLLLCFVIITDFYAFNRQGILDVFLAVIAKALTVQLKTKGGEGGKSVATQGKGAVTSVSLASTMPTPQANSPRWWLQGSATQKQADLIISLIRDMTMV